MVRLFIRHQVDSFEEWKLAYDVFAQERNDMTVLGDGVYQSVVDPEDVTVWHDFKSVEAALAFAGAPVIGRAMEAAGVTGEPVMWIARQV